MPVGAIAPVTRWQIMQNGQPAAGAKLYTYLSGTSTPQSVFTTSALNVAHANPVVADANGILPICYLAAVSYRFTVTASDGTTIFPAQDNIYDFAQLQLGGSGGSALVGFIQAGSGAVARTAQSKLRERITPEDFGAVGDGTTDDYAALVLAVAAVPANGGTLSLAQGAIYKTTQILQIARGNLVVEGNSAEILFQPTSPLTHDRAINIHAGDGGSGFSSLRPIAAAIALGATGFTLSAAGDGTDLVAGMWLTVQETDAGVAGEIVIIDWVQVLSVVGTAVSVMAPFRTAFAGLHSTINFRRVINLVENVTLTDLRIRTTDTTNPLLGVSVGIARQVVLNNVTSAPAKGNAFFSYRAADLTLTNCHQRRNIGQATEFAATVDLKVIGNTLNTQNISPDGSQLVLDYGTAFFAVLGNTMPSPGNIAIQITYGVHDGVISGNSIGYVRDAGITNTSGISSLGSQRIRVVHNVFAGGAGTSVGIGFGPTTGLVSNFLSVDNVIGDNSLPGFSNPYSLTPSATDVYVAPSGGIERYINGLLLGESAAALDTLLYQKHTTAAKLGTRYELTGVSNYFQGVDVSGGLMRYWLGFNSIAQRDVWVDQSGRLIVNNSDSTGGLRVGATGNVIRRINVVEGINKTAADYSANPILANTSATFTLATPGAIVGLAAFASPDRTIGTGLVWSAFISATDVVTVVVANVTTGNIAPATALWGAVAFRVGS